MTTLYCQVCGKAQHEVAKLIAGPMTFICNECLDLCHGISHPSASGEASKPKGPAPYAPSSFGCHEALHVAYLLYSIVRDHLVEHPAITRRADWTRLANEAAAKLLELYRAISAEHLAEPMRKEPLKREVIGFGETG